MACLVFKKERNGNRGNICFIDASKHYSADGKMNYLTDEDIDRIVNAYVERKDIERFCHIASMDEIIENDYNLNISRYVDTYIPEAPVDIAETKEKIKKYNLEEKEIMDKIAATLAELGL